MKPTLFFNFAGCRIGDKCGSAWMLGTEAHRRGLSVSWVDDRANDLDSFSVAEFFPLLAERRVFSGETEEFHTGNVWTNGPALFKQMGRLGECMMTPPVNVPTYDVALHVLTDAPYNYQRNMNHAQCMELAAWIESDLGLSVWIVPPLGSSAAGILNKLSGARMFIGGDTGFSHAYAMMRPDRPLVWFGPDQSQDKASFGQEWDSAPFTNNLYRFQLTNHAFPTTDVVDCLRDLASSNHFRKGAMV